MSNAQVVVYSLSLAALEYGTLAYLRVNLLLNIELIDAE